MKNKITHSHLNNYFKDISKISELLSKSEIEKLVKTISKIKNSGGRIFLLELVVVLVIVLMQLMILENCVI